MTSNAISAPCDVMTGDRCANQAIELAAPSERYFGEVRREPDIFAVLPYDVRDMLIDVDIGSATLTPERNAASRRAMELRRSRADDLTTRVAMRQIFMKR